MSPSVYVVTGGGRGIGFRIVEELSAQTDTIVYAGVRSFPPTPESPLGQLAAKFPKVVIPVKITSGDPGDNAAAAALVKEQVGHVNVVIANAGGTARNGFTTILDITPELLHADIEINAVSPIVLYKAFAPLLLAGNAAQPASAKFVVISSSAGQITDAGPAPVDSYGCSKAAVNYLVKRLDIETPEIVAFPMHPGAVDTEGFNDILKDMSAEQIASLGAITPTDSAKGILSVVAKATKETHGGKFWNEKGEQMTY